MPPKRANNKKQQTKLAASSAIDAEILDNGVKELGEVISVGSESLTNGSEIKLEEMTKVTKRTTGRGKIAAPMESEQQMTVDKKPAAKGRGKKKTSEIEVIQNENELEQEIREEVAEAIEERQAEEEIATKTKGRGKKSETKTKKIRISKKNEKLQHAEESVQEEVIANAATAAAENSGKKSKVMVGKRKKQEANDKETEGTEEKLEELEEEPIEKGSKRSPRGLKKVSDISLDEEPLKKKSKSVKKVKSEEKKLTLNNDSIESSLLEIKAETKKDKKPTKRSRKAVININETVTENGEGNSVVNATDDVLPKKRSRKIISTEKEIVAEKPKKGRGKKAVKPSQPEEEVVAVSLEETEVPPNGQVKDEKVEQLGVIEEFPKTKKRTTKKTEPEQEPEEEPHDASNAEPTLKARGRKRAAPSANKKSKKAAEVIIDDGEDNELEDEADGGSKPKTKKKTDSAAPLNATNTTYNKEDFDLAPLAEGETAEEPRYNLKISSWNVAGLRSWLKKGGLTFLDYEQSDIFCMQETKCTTDQLPEEVERIPGYHPYWLCMPGGYAGVAIYSKIMPINVEYGIGNKEFDDSGRIITAEYEKFFLINVYVPNSGRKLVNLEPRMKWEQLFQEFVQKLDARKPVVICGDMNVSHQEIDLANPKTNTRNAGFTKEERDKMSELLALGYVDTFRHLYPDRKGAYTFWTYMGNARSRNVGWRLDYFIVSERFLNRVVDNCIRQQCLGSDHCPITLYLKM